MSRRSSTEALIGAARDLSVDIKTQDGVANAALREIADRLEEQQGVITKLYGIFQESENRNFRRLFPMECLRFVKFD